MRYGVRCSQAPVFAQGTTSGETTHPFDLSETFIYGNRKYKNVFYFTLKT